MNGRDAQPLQRETVGLRAVPFMFPQPIALIVQIQFTHIRVASGLRQHGGGRDAQAMHIAFHKRGL